MGGGVAIFYITILASGVGGVAIFYITNLASGGGCSNILHDLSVMTLRWKRESKIRTLNSSMVHLLLQ